MKIDALICDFMGCRTLDKLAHFMSNVTQQLDFSYFALIHHAHPRDWPQPLIMLNNYPASWVTVYDRKRLFLNDPVLKACKNSTVGFAWDDLDAFLDVTLEHRAILDLSAREGLGAGYTVPANIPGELPGSCSFVTKAGIPLPRDNLLVAQFVGAAAFQTARRIVGLTKADTSKHPGLTPRQKDCLLWAMRGKTDGEIATILGLSEETVSQHLNMARARYDVTKRLPLALKAIYMGHIDLEDVFDKVFLLKGE